MEECFDAPTGVKETLLLLLNRPDLLEQPPPPPPPSHPPVPQVNGSGHVSTLCSSNCIDPQRSPKANESKQNLFSVNICKGHLS